MYILVTGNADWQMRTLQYVSKNCSGDARREESSLMRAESMRNAYSSLRSRYSTYR